MNKEQLLVRLRELAQDDDPERIHSQADDALLAYINDPEIADAWRALERWYA